VTASSVQARKEQHADMASRILIADDEAHILHVVSLKLRNAGYQVITAVDGEEALDLCMIERPDLVITDYQMPLMSGLQLCKCMRANPATRDVPAILLTAREFDIEPEEIREAKISAVMAKPFAPRELLEKVKELLAKAHEASSRPVSRLGDP